MKNEEIIKRVMAWQMAGFVHPLTCIVSKHGSLTPIEVDGEVVLKCQRCKYIQKHIPPSVLSVTPEFMEEQKRELIAKGFKFQQPINMEKKLYFKLETIDGEGGTMELSGCMEWIKGDLDSNYPQANNLPEDELPQYIITPIWLTDDEYDALPEQ